jgi:hypothetical protein
VPLAVLALAGDALGMGSSWLIGIIPDITELAPLVDLRLPSDMLD